MITQIPNEVVNRCKNYKSIRNDNVANDKKWYYVHR